MRRNKLDYSEMSIEELRKIAQPLFYPEDLEKNLITENPIFKNNHFIPNRINHVMYKGYLYCIYVTTSGIPAGVIEIRDAKVYGICVLEGYRGRGIGTELLKDAKRYASEIYGPFVPEMVNKIWRFYHGF